MPIVAAPLETQSAPAPGAIYRVFLKDGQALPSFGESAFVDDRVVFTLVIGHPLEQSSLQLMSLPVQVVDVERTADYATAVRAAHYAATRGEADYQAMTAEVQRSVDRLAQIQSPQERLKLAQEAKRRLLAWSRENYSYRAGDIQVLAALFDDVIDSLRPVVGESGVSLEFDAHPLSASLEAVLAAPDLRESLTLALRAATLVDRPEQRTAILQAAAIELARSEGLDDLADEVVRRLAAERAIDKAYETLVRSIHSRAGVLVARGDVRGMLALIAELGARDRELGSVRPADVASLAAWLDVELRAARAQRLALDHYAQARPALLAYERDVRRAMTDFDSLMPVLEAIRDETGTPFDALVRAEARLQQIGARLQLVAAPAGLVDVHATLRSAVHLAAQACARRKTAVASLSHTVAGEASAAAAGALLLAGSARETMVQRLFPPKIPAR